MIPKHALFIQAVQDKKKVWVKFYSKADNGVLEHPCAPLEYGPGVGVQDGLNRYWLWDFASSTGSHTLGLLPQQIVDLTVLGEVFDSGQFTVGVSPAAVPPKTELKPMILSLLFLAAFAVGCDQEPTTTQQLDKVKTETKEAAQNMKDYTYAQKAEFVQQMQTQLTALNQDLDKLSAKIESSSDAVKAEAKPKLQALRDQAAQLNKQLDDVKNASESTWDSVKAGSKKAYAALADGFQQARQWASDKIAP